MEASLRKILYTSTSEHHQRVEGIFGLGEKTTTDALMLLYRTILSVRTQLSSPLKELEDMHRLPSWNALLMEALKKDLGSHPTQEAHLPAHAEVLTASSPSPWTDLSVRAGFFYVFAGSSAGAKMMLQQVKEERVDCPLNYFHLLVQQSTHQLNFLKKLLTDPSLEPPLVVDSARYTFDLIYETALNELRKRTSQLENA